MATAPRLEGDSALIVEIPEAEPVVGDLRELHDVAGVGVPAHVTVIYPFLPSDRIDGSETLRLEAHFAGIDGFEYRFARADQFDHGNVHLAPEPADRFAALTAATAAAWPECPPYGGIHDVVVPHLTVGDRLEQYEAEELFQLVRARLDRVGPIRGSATEVSLLTFVGSRWTRAARYPLREAAR